MALLKQFGTEDEEILKQMQMRQQPAPTMQAQPSYVAPQQPGFFQRLGSGIKEFTSDPERMARLTMALNSMRMQPDAGIAAMAQSRLDTAQQQKLLQSQANKTAEFFKAQGRDDLAMAIRQNPAIASDILKAYYGSQFKSPSAFNEKVDALSAFMPRDEAVKIAASSGGTTVNMPSVGSIPAGYQAIYDDAGRVVRMEPIAGGPVATEVETTEQTAKKNYEAYKTGIESLSKAFGMANTGSLVGLAPALTSGDLSFEGMRDVMLQPLKSIFKGKGEGAFTDDDARQLLNMMPTRRDTEESAQFKLRAADQIIRAKLGLPLSDEPRTIKRYNQVTRQIEEIAQ